MIILFFVNRILFHSGGIKLLFYTIGMKTRFSIGLYMHEMKSFHPTGWNYQKELFSSRRDEKKVISSRRDEMKFCSQKTKLSSLFLQSIIIISTERKPRFHPSSIKSSIRHLVEIRLCYFIPTLLYLDRTFFTSGGETPLCKKYPFFYLGGETPSVKKCSLDIKTAGWKGRISTAGRNYYLIFNSPAASCGSPRACVYFWNSTI